MKNKVIHSILINNTSYSNDLTMKRLEQVLSSGSILSKRNLGENISENTYNGCNGIDHISLCDLDIISSKSLDSTDFFNGAYNYFTRKTIGFVFDKKDLNIIYPHFVNPLFVLSLSYEQRIKLFNDIERYSTMYDEVQVKDYIDLKLVDSLVFPLEYFIKIGMSKTMILESVIKIESLLQKYGYNLPIYALPTIEELFNKDKNDKKLSLVKDKI